jgi:hypothetical protein
MNPYNSKTNYANVEDGYSLDVAVIGDTRKDMVRGLRRAITLLNDGEGCFSSQVGDNCEVDIDLKINGRHFVK